MRKRTKTIIYYTVTFLAILAFVTWYLFPYLTNKLYMLTPIKGLRPFVEIKPTYIKKLLNPPEEWDEITIGELSLKIPLSECVKVFNHGNSIFFKLSSGAILSIFDMAPDKEFVQLLNGKQLDYPLIPYSQWLAVFNSTPSDISLLNTRSKNMEALANQILKAISIPTIGFYEVNIVNTNELKAICNKSKDDKNRFTAFINIYSQNEAVSFTMMLIKYKDKGKFDTDLLKILGGMKVPGHPLDIEIVEKDIQTIVGKYSEKV